MAFDLAIGPTNDLLFGANKDLLGIDGLPLVEQRIRLRLKMIRGSWIYDTQGTLGSRLDSVIGRASNEAFSQLTMFVHEALDEMPDISVTHVVVEPSPDTITSVIVKVFYLMNIAPDEAPFDSPDTQQEEATVTFQL